MRYNLLSAFIFFYVLGFSQTKGVADAVITEEPIVVNDSDRVYQVVEQMPEFPGGEQAMMNFIQKNLQYPILERENDIQGRVIIGFVVEEDGSLSNIQVKRGVSIGIAKEAVRLIKSMPRFKPGRQSGKLVRVQYNLPIVFKLAGDMPKSK